MEMIILVGLPGSGKSTSYVENFADTHVRINLDMLKTRRKEKLLLQACLEAKQDCVVDNTNVTKKERKIYLAMAKGYPECCIVARWMMTGYTECISRNKLRAKPVPRVAIATKSKELEPPTIEEGFDEVQRVVSVNEETYYWNRRH